MKFAISEYENESAEGVVSAVAELPGNRSAPVAIVFRDQRIISDTVNKLLDKQVLVVTIGEDDVNSGRIAHSGENSENFGYIWGIRAMQLEPQPRNVLLLIGDAPAHIERLKGALFARSESWARYKLRTRRTAEASDDDFAWADLVAAFGEDAARVAATKGKRLFVADSSEFSLSLLDNGTALHAIVPDYFQLGYRSFRLAREYFIQGTLANAVVSMPYKEVEKATIGWYKEKRYSIPPVSANSR